jgi:hypothetical protein
MKQKLMGRLMAATLISCSVGQVAWAIPDSLPRLQHAGPVTYLSGGVGADESAAIKAQMPNYPVVLEFAGTTQAGNEYLADVPVRITDMHGKTVLETDTRGPFLLVALPPGRYSVAATYQGKTVHRKVNVALHGHVRELFLWQM